MYMEKSWQCGFFFFRVLGLFSFHLKICCPLMLFSFPFIYTATNSKVGQAILGYMALEGPRISGYIAKIFWLYSQGFLICAVDCESFHVQ